MNNNIALEFIALQKNDKVVDDLVECLSRIKEKIESDVFNYSGKEIKDMNEIIFKRFGMNLKVRKANVLLGGPAYVQVKPLSPYNTNLTSSININDINPKEVEHFLKKSFKKVTKQKGSIDTKKVKVDGFYSEVKSAIYFDFKHLFKKSKMTEREVASVMMHEIGHMFTWFLADNRFSNLNTALYSSLNTDKYGTIETKLEQLEKKGIKVEKATLDSIFNGNTIARTVSSLKLLKDNMPASSLNLSLYEKNSEENSEIAADNFAYKFGLGKELASSLSKLMHNNNIDSSMNLMLDLFFIKSLIETIYVLLTSFSVIISVSPLALPFIISFFTIVLLLNSSSFSDRTYPEYISRLKKIYNGSLEALKNTDLDNKEKKEVLEDLKAIKMVIENANQYDSFKEVLGNILFKAGARAKAGIIQQDVLDDLANNPMYVQAAELSLLS